MSIKHEFTEKIFTILKANFGDDAEDIYAKSELLKYLNVKTKSASRGSKSRGSFANIYAIKVLIEDYVQNGFAENAGYKDYEGAIFSDLLTRLREYPFGDKLQNHALNSRLNEEFKKFFPTTEFLPIIRNLETKRYWINEHILKVNSAKGDVNIATCIIEIIDKYVSTKQEALDDFIF